jgi:hypothetical protein
VVAVGGRSWWSQLVGAFSACPASPAFKRRYRQDPNHALHRRNLLPHAPYRTGAFDTMVAKQGVSASPIWVIFVLNVLKRTSENSVNTKFAEFHFQALG